MVRGFGRSPIASTRAKPCANDPVRKCVAAVIPDHPPVELVEPLRCDRLAHPTPFVMMPIDLPPSPTKKSRDPAERLCSGVGSTKYDALARRLASKDVIDIQVSVEQDSDLDGVARELEKAGWTPRSDINQDHDVPGMPVDERARQKWFLRGPGSRRVIIHVRVMGHANQRYPLLFRDYLRAHPFSAHSYATLKKDLARLLQHDYDRYAEVKDAACWISSISPPKIWLRRSGGARDHPTDSRQPERRGAHMLRCADEHFPP